MANREYDFLKHEKSRYNSNTFNRMSHYQEYAAPLRAPEGSTVEIPKQKKKVPFWILLFRIFAPAAKGWILGWLIGMVLKLEFDSKWKAIGHDCTTVGFGLGLAYGIWNCKRIWDSLAEKFELKMVWELGEGYGDRRRKGVES